MIGDDRKQHLPSNNQTLPKLWGSYTPTSTSSTVGLLPFWRSAIFRKFKTRITEKLGLHHNTTQSKGEVLKHNFRTINCLVLHMITTSDSKLHKLQFINHKSYRKLLSWLIFCIKYDLQGRRNRHLNFTYFRLLCRCKM